jgi:flagellar hook assembly protein FlgD
MQKTTAVNVKVYDMNGRIVKSQQFSAQSGSNKFTIAALNNLNSGLYVVEVTAGEEKWMQKIIK